jgi:replicative DNA helicase
MIAVLDSEHALLGAAMYDPQACADVLDRVKPEHFAEPTHGLIWGELRKGGVTDPVLLASKLASVEAFETLGGLGFLADLVDRAVTHTAPAHAEAVLDAVLRRRLRDLAAATVADAESKPGEGEALIVQMERAASDIARDSTGTDKWRPAWEITAGAVQRARERKGRIDLPTGLADLDRLTGGFRRGELAIVAGRPSMGKSTAALALARSLAASGKGVAFFSMEMPDVALGLRMACDVAYDRFAPPQFRISYFDADRGDLMNDQWRELNGASKKMEAWPLLFDVRPGLTTSQMEACARRAFRRWEADGIERGAVIVDHLTIARPDQDRKGNKVAEVGDISRGLAEMAKRLDVPVIGLCQLSRDVEKRDGKDRRPNLSDLRWSGEIEQDARLVMFLYRPEYYVRKPEDATDISAEAEWRTKLEKTRHKLFWLVEKNNNGPTGEVETFCDIACSAIRDRGVQ